MQLQLRVKGRRRLEMAFSSFSSISLRSPSFLIFLFIFLESCNGQINRPPEFVTGGDMSNLYINEDTPIGSSVYTLKGRDPDGGRLFYYLSGDTFSVDKDTGVVKLIRSLDREREPFLDVIITVIDEKVHGKAANTVSLQKEVKVADTNDNRPQFTGGPYAFVVSEATHPFTTVYEGLYIVDADAGANSQVTIECDRELTPDACEKFHINYVQLSEGKYKGSVSLKSAQLDFESVPSYTMRLVAKDRGGLSSTADVTIAVQDVQDEPPRFINAPYSLTVNESSSTDTPVLTVFVRDGDATPTLRRPLKVELLRDVKRYFSLKQSSDETWVLQTTQVAIDREDPEILLRGGIYEVGLRAVELINGRESGDVTLANVTVVINDINDQLPNFNLKTVRLTIPEDIANGSAIPGLNLIVADTDIGNNARFSLLIEDLDDKNPASAAFSVSPAEAIGRTPVIVKVINSDLLDFENELHKTFVFNVVALQEGVRSVSRVMLLLSDANDHVPTFESDQYHIQIPENMPSNMTVFTLQAEDADSGDYSTITYTLRGFGADKFSVDGQSGEISIAACGTRSSSLEHFGSFNSREEDDSNELCLDYEAQPSYSLTYEARDGGGRHSSTNLFIEIVDVNDNVPQFLNTLHIRELFEHDLNISPPLTVKATDADGPAQGGNSGVRYIIKDTNLTGLAIDAVTGEVRLTVPVQADFEFNRATGIRKKLHYEAIVRAVDGGEPPLESEAKLIFHVKSERDGAPMFILNEPYNVSVNENAKPGTVVVQVKATDPDGPDASLRYALIDGAKDNFVINDVTGEIMVSSEAELDPDLYGSKYLLKVSVVDAAFPIPLTTITTVHVTIDDVNNKPPKFSSDSYVVYLTDGQLSVGHEVIQVFASDPDTRSNIRFSIDEENIMARDKTGVLLVDGNQQFGKSFRIDPTTGSIKLGQKLDAAKASVIVVPVVASDVNALDSETSPQRTVAELTVYIRRNDAKNPVFAYPWSASEPNYYISLPEESLVGSTLMTLSAKDALTNKAITEFEKIKETDPDNLFSVSPLTGIVTLNKRMDFEELLVKQIRFTVRAVGVGQPATNSKRPSSVANIILSVKDINDNSPVFTQDAYTAAVLESARWPQSVITVSATDRDGGEYGTLLYSVSGDGSELFDIDPKTGIIGIRRNVTLDRELKSAYNLQVTATDNNVAKEEDVSSVVQRKTSVLVKINLIDVNDNKPKFDKENYDTIVPENVPIGFIVGYLHATDPDDGSNGEITYEIIGFEDLPERNRLFVINRTTGVLSVAASLSGKGRPEPYDIQIKATDNGKRPLDSEVNFSIVIGDISANDGIPTFVKPAENEVITVNENAKPGTFIYQVEAVDADNPNTANGKVMYKFLDPIPYFEIDPLSGFITTATNRRQRPESYVLDREQRENYTLILVAYDLGLPPQESHRVLFIRVNDTDDNEARFVRTVKSSPVRFEVAENVSVGSEVARVTAVDEDIGANAAVTYEIINGNEREIFSIVTDQLGNGVIRTTRPVDRESDEKFLITVRAKNARKATPFIKYLPYNREDLTQIQVEISLKDVDDNPPRFEQKSYVIGVKLNVELHNQLIIFRAQDPDVSEVPAKITYGLAEASFIAGRSVRHNVVHVFSVENSTGILRNEVILRSYAGGYFNLTIEAISHTGSQANNSSTRSLVNCKVFILRDKDFLKFVFKRRPNDINKSLKQLENDFGHALAVTSPLKMSLNFDATQYNQRRDGSLDFEATSACFQLIRSTDTGNVLVLDHEEGIKFLRPDNSAPHSKSLRDLYDNYDIVSVEECVAAKNNYKITKSEMGILLVAVGMAIMSVLLACLASSMKKKLKQRMATLGIISGYNGPVFVGTQTPPVSSPYGVPITKTPSFISMVDHQRIYEWQEATNPPLDTVSFRSFPTLR